MLFSSLQKICGGVMHLSQDIEINRFSIDSRTSSNQSAEIFVAIKGKRDGHDYAGKAWERGVRNFMLEKELPLPESNILVVENSLGALQHVAKHHREQFQIPLIAITGSNGKTTVKEWLATLLSEQFFVVKSPKSYNSQVGVPLSLLEIKANHEVGVFEAGISEKGEMQKLQEMLQPTLGVLTNLGQAHDDGFDSDIQKLQEKLALFDATDKVVCRKEMPFYGDILKALNNRIVSWGFDDDTDYQVAWSEGLITINDQQFSTELSGSTQLENLTHAIVMAMEIGVPPDAIKKGISLIKDIPMRLELKKGINGCYILDDSYNNDEAGLKVALDYLETHKQKPKRVLILSDLLHSGKPDQHLYEQISILLSERGIRFIGVGERISAVAHLFPSSSLFYESTEVLLENMPEFKDEMIVIKGARDFRLERVAKKLEEKVHGTVLEINFEALQYNLNQYRSLLNPPTKLMVMVKANAYGSGILEVANFLQHQQVDMLGVAYVDEAIQLRQHGITIPIMIMNPYPDGFGQFERYNLQAEIFSLSHFRRMVRDTSIHPKIHLKIDTGMHRLGFAKEDIPALIQDLQAHPSVQVEGIFTHFSSSDSLAEDEYTIAQATLFDEIYEQIGEAIGYKPMKHACNSAGIARWPQYHYDMVRLGVGLHGFDPTGHLTLKYPAALKTVISQIQILKAGDTVGYSRKGVIETDSRVAVIPLGYEDGYARAFGNGKAHVAIRGKLCPTVGNICMDMTMVDVTSTGACEGDEVIVFGEQPTICDLAQWADTIPYETLTNVSNRVKRVFISE